MNQTLSNGGPAKTLLREQFRRTGRPVMGALVLSLVMIWGTALFKHATNGDGDMDEFSALLGVCTYCMVIAIILWGYSDTSNLRADIPAYALRLPLKTSVLMLWRMAYNLVAVALVCGALTVSVSMVLYSPFGEEFLTSLNWNWLWVGILFYLLIQTVIWFVSNYKVLFICILVLWLLLYSVWIPVKSHLDDYPFVVNNPLLILVLVSLPIAYVLSVIGVHARRHGLAPLSSVLTVSLRNRVRVRATGPNEFESPQQAQLWFESRHISRLLPVTALCSMAFLLAGAQLFISAGLALWEFLNTTELARALFVLAVYGTPVGAVIAGGFIFSKNYRSQTNPNSGFFFNRPISCKDLATARFLAVGKSVAIAAAFVVCAALIAFLQSGIDWLVPLSQSANNDFAGSSIIRTISVSDIVILSLMLAGFMVIVWCLMWFGNLAGTLFVPALIAYLFYTLVSVLDEVFDIRFFTDAEAVGFVACGATLYAMTAYLMVKAHTKKLLNVRCLAATAIFLMVIAAGTVATSGRHWGEIDPEVLPALLPLALAPLATVPLTMHWARHQ